MDACDNKGTGNPSRKNGICTAVTPTFPIPDMIDDVRASLLTQPRSLSSKYFYDERGSELFDQICDTPEYYPTQTENLLLEQYAPEIIEKTCPKQILELGSGCAVKTRHLFNACEAMDHHCIYAPFDVCEEVLIDSRKKLKEKYGWLKIEPLLGDYHGGLGNLPTISGKCLFVFLGSTIGNFEKAEALWFIRELKEIMQSGDTLLLGVDRIKNSSVLNAAYNDQQGLTAKFNLNILYVINRELNADFKLEKFRHHAAFDAGKSRVEMRLVSVNGQKITIKDLNESIQFEQGEAILTEVCQKYNYSDIEKMLSIVDLSIIGHYEDKRSYFSLILASK